MILGFVEHDGGSPTPLSLEMLTFARRLTGELGVPLQAVAIGPDADAIAKQLPGHGVSSVHVVEHDFLDGFAPEAWAKGVVELIETLAPQAVLAAGSDRGNEVMAHIGARMGLAMAANCTDVRAGEPYLVTRQRWGGSLLEEARLEGRVKLLTVAPHAVVAEEAPADGELAIDVLRPALVERDLRVRVTERVASGGGKISLPEARVVVGGGRGVGGADGFAILEELAALLGGTVGVSRVATSLGWRPHSDQIGQTGTRIAPELYIACGISGAIQHMVGCKAAKKILAINTDPDAPMVARADYAVIGDLHAVVRALIAEIRDAGSR